MAPKNLRSWSTHQSSYHVFIIDSCLMLYRCTTKYFVKAELFGRRVLYGVAFQSQFIKETLLAYMFICRLINLFGTHLFHTHGVMDVYVQLCIVHSFIILHLILLSGTWETKVSNKEKREQRKKDKSSSDGSASPGGGGGGGTPMSATPEQRKASAAASPANQKKKKGLDCH